MARGWLLGILEVCLSCVDDVTASSSLPLVFLVLVWDLVLWRLDGWGVMRLVALCLGRAIGTVVGGSVYLHLAEVGADELYPLGRERL